MLRIDNAKTMDELAALKLCITPGDLIFKVVMDDWEMVSLMDMSKYRLPTEVITGGIDNIRPLESEFFRLELLGEGPNSKVYKVKEKKSNKFFALKFIKDNELKSKLPQDLFREITNLRNLNHEHVIKLINVYLDTDPQNILLTFEICRCNLFQYIQIHQNDTVKHDQVKCVMVQLFRGLNYLHNNCIVHRDIKPQNILITEEGSLKIADFGISRRFSNLERPSTPGKMTLYYQAPEMLLEASHYDEKVDIWSAGCVLVELMTKRPFFGCSNEFGLINRMCQVLGSPTTKNWPGLKDCKYYGKVNLSGHSYNKLADYLQELKCGPAYELLKDIFVYNPKIRASAEQCLSNDWFERAPMPAKKLKFPVIDMFDKMFMLEK